MLVSAGVFKVSVWSFSSLIRDSESVVSFVIRYFYLTFLLFSHLVDAFIQSDLQIRKSY